MKPRHCKPDRKAEDRRKNVMNINEKYTQDGSPFWNNEIRILLAATLFDTSQMTEKSKIEGQMKLLFIILRSIIYVPLFILLFGWIALNVRVFDRQIGVILPSWVSSIGIIFMTCRRNSCINLCSGICYQRKRNTCSF